MRRCGSWSIVVAAFWMSMASSLALASSFTLENGTGNVLSMTWDVVLNPLSTSDFGAFALTVTAAGPGEGEVTLVAGDQTWPDCPSPPCAIVLGNSVQYSFTMDEDPGFIPAPQVIGWISVTRSGFGGDVDMIASEVVFEDPEGGSIPDTTTNPLAVMAAQAAPLLSAWALVAFAAGLLGTSVWRVRATRRTIR